MDEKLKTWFNSPMAWPDSDDLKPKCLKETSRLQVIASLIAMKNSQSGYGRSGLTMPEDICLNSMTSYLKGVAPEGESKREVLKLIQEEWDRINAGVEFK